MSLWIFLLLPANLAEGSVLEVRVMLLLRKLSPAVIAEVCLAAARHELAARLECRLETTFRALRVVRDAIVCEGVIPEIKLKG